MRENKLLKPQSDRPGLILDVGYYGECFVVQVIKDGDWKSPVERCEVREQADLTGIVDALVIKYAEPPVGG